MGSYTNNLRTCPIGGGSSPHEHQEDTIMSKYLIGLTAALLLMTGAVFAAQHEKGMMGEQSSFNTLDANHDGTISKEEAQADASLAKSWDKADANSDGKIEESEFARFEEEHQSGQSGGMMQEQQQQPQE
jgi:hypothetical protein